MLSKTKPVGSQLTIEDLNDASICSILGITRTSDIDRSLAAGRIRILPCERINCELLLEIRRSTMDILCGDIDVLEDADPDDPRDQEVAWGMESDHNPCTKAYDINRFFEGFDANLHHA